MNLGELVPTDPTVYWYIGNLDDDRSCVLSIRSVRPLSHIGSNVLGIDWVMCMYYVSKG